jgi:hypothetical protein
MPALASTTVRPKRNSLKKNAIALSTSSPRAAPRSSFASSSTAVFMRGPW